jgi:hypothetical protein
MQPAQLSVQSFQAYPPRGRALAEANLTLLQNLPLGFLPFLLRDVIAFDWKFPYEQGELTRQLDYLRRLLEQKGPSLAGANGEMEPFAKLRLSDKLASADWVNQPAQFLEQLSAHLWATRQMDGFREASESYVRKFNTTLPAEQLPEPRLGIAVFGEGASGAEYKLFRKLRRSGVYFSRLNPANGLAAIHEALKARAAAHAVLYAHWCIEGGSILTPLPGFTCVDYDGLAAVRKKLSAIMLSAYESAEFDPEKLRTAMAEVTPEAAGMKDSGDGALERFQLSLLTEGSGTQVYSTTFVQWAAREALRRAHPLTIFTRYAPRQKERTMDELLSGRAKGSAPDWEGSLIDGDMGAFYTWVNMQRLAGADDARFLAWFEGHGEAVAIGPGLKAATEDTAPIEMVGLLERVQYS